MEALTKREKFMKHCCLGNGTEEQNEYYRAHCMSAEEVLIGKPVFEMDKREFLEDCVLCENLKKGDLPYGDCPKCRNKGYIAGIDDEGNEYQEVCSCVEDRRNRRELARSEFGELLRTKTFERFKFTAPWQKPTVARCKEWTRQKQYPLMALLGKSGTGKTHLAVATFRIAVARGAHGTFLSWAKTANDLKRTTGTTDYEHMMRGLKYAPLLYFDDFLWKPKGAIPTDWDLALAKEILDARFYNRRRTIITSNLSLVDLGKTFPGASLLSSAIDRFIEDAISLQFVGDSYRRLKWKRREATINAAEDAPQTVAEDQTTPKPSEAAKP